MPAEHKNYWNTTTVPPNGKWLSGAPKEVDYLIVGAGGAGMTTAFCMARQGLKDILVVDPTLPVWRSARKQIGVVSTMPVLPTDLKEKGFTDEQIKNLTTIGLMNAAFTERFMWQFADGENWCEKESMGGFRTAFKRTDMSRLEDSLPYFEELPMKPFLLTGEALKTATGLRNGHLGLFNPHDFCVNPARYLNGMTTAARYLGVDILSGFTVSNVVYDRPWWTVVDRYGNTIRARYLILCMGASFGDIGNFDELSHLFSRRRIQYFATGELTDRLPPFSITDADGKNFVRTHRGRVIAALDNDDENLADLQNNKSSLNVIKGQLSYRLNCTHSADLKPEFIWTRNVLSTPDGLPIVTNFDTLPNLYVNMGYNEHSLSYQMICGMTIAGLIKDGKYVIPGTDIFAFERMK